MEYNTESFTWCAFLSASRVALAEWFSRFYKETLAFQVLLAKLKENITKLVSSIIYLNSSEDTKKLLASTKTNTISSVSFYKYCYYVWMKISTKYSTTVHYKNYSQRPTIFYYKTPSQPVPFQCLVEWLLQKILPPLA